MPKSASWDGVGIAPKTPDYDKHGQEERESHHPANDDIHTGHSYFYFGRIRFGQPSTCTLLFEGLYISSFRSPELRQRI